MRPKLGTGSEAARIRGIWAHAVPGPADPPCDAQLAHPAPLARSPGFNSNCQPLLVASTEATPMTPSLSRPRCGVGDESVLMLA